MRQKTDPVRQYCIPQARLAPWAWVLIVAVVVITTTAFQSFVTIPVVTKRASGELTRMINAGEVVIEIRRAPPRRTTMTEQQAAYDAFVGDMRAIAGDDTLFTEEPP